MNEVATAFRPYQISLGFQLTVGTVVLEVSVLGETLTGNHISTLLADGGKHFAGYPMLESFGAFEFGGEDEGVKSRFVDEGGSLLSA